MLFIYSVLIVKINERLNKVCVIYFANYDCQLLALFNVFS